MDSSIEQYMKNVTKNRIYMWKKLRRVCRLIYEIDQKISEETDENKIFSLLERRSKLEKERKFESDFYQVVTRDYFELLDKYKKYQQTAWAKSRN